MLSVDWFFSLFTFFFFIIFLCELVKKEKPNTPGADLQPGPRWRRGKGTGLQAVAGAAVAGSNPRSTFCLQMQKAMQSAKRQHWVRTHDWYRWLPPSTVLLPLHHRAVGRNSAPGVFVIEF